MKLLKLIKKHPERTAAMSGATLIGLGLLALVPRSPWTLIIVGSLLLIGTLASYLPHDVPPPK